MTTEKILLEGNLLPHHLPLLLMDEAEQKMEWITPVSQDGSLDPLVEGNVNYAVARPMNLVSEVLNASSIKGIARFFHTDCGIIYRTDSDLDSPSDLKNHTVGYRQISEQNVVPLLNRAIRKDGGEPENNWSLEAVPEKPFEALNEGKIDLLLPGWIVPDGIRMQLRGINGDFWHFSDYDIPANGDLILITTQDHVEANPNKILNFVHSVHQSLKEIRLNSDQALKYYKKQRPDIADNPETTALVQTTIDGFTDVFSQDYATYSSWSTFFNEETDVEGLVDIDQLIDERFLPVDAMSF